MKYIFPTKSESTLEETTVGIFPTNTINSTNKGIFYFFVSRYYEIFQRSTIALGIVSILLLLCCMVCCVCCLKKRGEVYILRNATGIENRVANVSEAIPMSAAERGEMHPQEELRRLDTWRTNVRNRNTPGAAVPNYPCVQNLANTQIENEQL